MKMERIEEGAGSAPIGADRMAPARRGGMSIKLKIVGATMLCLAGAACSGTGPAPRSDEEKVVLATLQLLAAPGRQLCVDAATTGRPLSVFRTMASNPPPGLKPLAWYAPAPLRPSKPLTAEQLYRGARSQTAIHIDQPTNTTATLNRAAQVQLDQAALGLSLRLADEGVKISRTWPVPGVKPRWWLRNRISFHCTPNYIVSNPVVMRNVAFVSVTADHWGTTYALAREGAAWTVRAQWSNWLY